MIQKKNPVITTEESSKNGFFGLNFINTTPEKRENIMSRLGVFLQILVGLATIFAIFYGLNEYKFEKKTDYTIRFLSTYQQTIPDYKYYLLRSTAETEIYKIREPAIGEHITQEYSIHTMNGKGMLDLVNYLAVADTISLDERDKLLDRYLSQEEEISKLFEEMSGEIIGNGDKFNDFSNETQKKIEKLQEEINKLVGELLVLVKE